MTKSRGKKSYYVTAAIKNQPLEYKKVKNKINVWSNENYPVFK